MSPFIYARIFPSGDMDNPSLDELAFSLLCKVALVTYVHAFKETTNKR